MKDYIPEVSCFWGIVHGLFIPWKMNPNLQKFTNIFARLPQKSKMFYKVNLALIGVYQFMIKKTRARKSLAIFLLTFKCTIVCMYSATADRLFENMNGEVTVAITRGEEEYIHVASS